MVLLPKMEQSVVFYSQGQKIYGNLALPRNRVPCVILSHGLESHKDSNKWLVLSSRFYDAGYATLRFNYRGCGEGEEKSEGNFEDTNLTSRIADFKAAIDFVRKAKVDTSRLGVIGSSFGGMAAVAAGDERIKAMAILATPSLIPYPSGESLEYLKKKGYLELGSGKRLRLSFYDDLHQYDIYEAVEQIRCPLLIIQGSRDEVVPVEHARELYHHANEPKRLEVIEGGDHTFSEAEHLNKVISLILDWFKKYL